MKRRGCCRLRWRRRRLDLMALLHRCFSSAFFLFFLCFFFLFRSFFFFFFFFFSPPPLGFPSLLLSVPLFSSSSSFSLVLCFFFLSYSLFMFSLPLLFYCFSSSCVFFLPYIQRGERRPTPLPSQWRRGVGWTGRPLFSRPSTTLGTALFPNSNTWKAVQVEGPWSTFFWVIRGREVGEKQGKKKYSSSPASRVQGKKTRSAFKTAPFRPLFFK